MNSWNPGGYAGGMEAINRYAQHLVDLQNPALQPFWQQVWAQQALCLRGMPWGGMGMGPGMGMGMRSPARTDISGEIRRGMPGPGPGPMMGPGVSPMGGAQEPPEVDDDPTAYDDPTGDDDPPPQFRMGQGVTPIEPHAPEHRGRVGQIVEVVTDQPFYAVDFGTGHGHKWYAESELRAVPPEYQAGQEYRP